MAFLGHLRPLWPLWPTVHKPWSVEPMGPFWPNSNESKRGQGGNPPAPKVRWVPNHKLAHLSQFWPPISTFPKMAKRTPRTTFWPLSTPGLWQPPEATSSSPARFPLNSGEELPFTNVICAKGFRCGAYMV
ncbi:hypothetical protein O181_011093 [Austropuccinia psidii MF-1]|uniref:Uncharacterized protein n=1 Tax=Austropuccinia psidii MF-1 TaxID=1389203 RepID=A0A9Q3BU79_9BASI|nr:hypothetical protein [Austropuccinia psidii MF-1]